MNWYQINNDMKQAFVYTFFQMENLLNFYITNSKAFEKIRLNQDFYNHSLNENFVVNCYINFNKVNNYKDINKINIWAKIVYWACDSKQTDYLTAYVSNFYNLVNIRNEENHRNSNSPSSYDKTIENLRQGDFTDFSFYINILKKIYKTCINIDDKVVEKGKLSNKSANKGLKVVGYIDLSKIQKK